MRETITIILMILSLAGTLFLALCIGGWKMKRAWDFIIADLLKKKAFVPASAVELSYSDSLMIGFGLRDYRSQALRELIKEDVVRVLEGRRYHLQGGYKLGG